MVRDWVAISLQIKTQFATWPHGFTLSTQFIWSRGLSLGSFLIPQLLVSCGIFSISSTSVQQSVSTGTSIYIAKDSFTLIETTCERDFVFDGAANIHKYAMKISLNTFTSNVRVFAFVQCEWSLTDIQIDPNRITPFYHKTSIESFSYSYVHICRIQIKVLTTLPFFFSWFLVSMDNIWKSKMCNWWQINISIQLNIEIPVMFKKNLKN